MPAWGVTSLVRPPLKSMSRAFGNGFRIPHPRNQSVESPPPMGTHPAPRRVNALNLHSRIGVIRKSVDS